MHIHKISIKNFRILENIDLYLETDTTVIVGRNNSGKTSLTELFRRLLFEKTPTFRLEDFSLSCHDKFWAAFKLKREGADDKAVREAIPSIAITLTVSYAADTTDLGALGAFIIDVNDDCTEVQIVIRYELAYGQIDSMFEGLDAIPITASESERIRFFRTMRDRVPKRFAATVIAVDPNDNTNEKSMEFSALRSLLNCSFINAQRGLDDITHSDRDVLGRILEVLFNTAMSDTADEEDRKIVDAMEKAIDQMQESIDTGFNAQLADLLPEFELFGYPGLGDPQLLTETNLDVQRLLTNHTRVHYPGINGLNLPESYCGLGTRNLVFILLKLLEFYKAFRAMPAAPAVHLVFIEEPEAHLHPQMQEVFVCKLSDIAQKFAVKFDKGNPWPVQFVITTHSSHVANRAPFDSMRYFLAASNTEQTSLRSTQVKDLRQGLEATTTPDREFLQKYMTLTQCDLLFADKAVLIEGPTERLLLPAMIEKLDQAGTRERSLSSQYVSTVEVGGAHAHLFFDLLKFLELRTLIVTDLDSINTRNNRKKCLVSEGNATSNTCINKWFNDGDLTSSVLLAKTESDKIRTPIRLSYQIPEEDGEVCGRSFEAAFILANPDVFELTDSDRETVAWEKADKITSKTEFALKYGTQELDWNVPRYIAEGLRWLAADVHEDVNVPVTATARNAETACPEEEEAHA